MSDRTATAPKKEPSEFELVLGNSQLLSLFFLVVILLGVTFATGYVIGRNSSPVETASAAIEAPLVRTNAPSALSADRVSENTGTGSTQSGRSESAPTATASQTPDPSEPARAADPSPMIMGQPKPGETYLQVLAVAKPEAEVLADVLLKKGFRAVVAAGPNETLFRVLVGPAKDSAEVVKLKGDLEQAGFRPFPKKY